MTNDEVWNAHDNWTAAGQYIARENGQLLDISTTVNLLESISDRRISQIKSLFDETNIEDPRQLFSFIAKLFTANPGHSTLLVAESIFAGSKVFEPGNHPEPATLKALLQGCAGLDKAYWELYHNLLPELNSDITPGLIDNLNKLLGSLNAKPSHGEGSGSLAK